MAGCERTQRMPAVPPVVDPPWRAEHSVVCMIADHPGSIPTCDAISAVYRAVEHPTWNYGIVVTRDSSERAECSGMYGPTGVHIGDLPFAE